MNKRILTLLFVCLIAVGAIVDHVLFPGSSGPSAAATSSPASSTVSTVPANITVANQYSISAIDRANEQAYAAASKSVVYVVNKGVGSGSGVIYDSQGDIVTNNHVIEGGGSLQVTLNDGRTFPARIVGTDRVDDLAVIRISASGLTPAHFAAQGQYQVAQTVLAIGSPVGLKQSVTSGLISGLHRVEQESTGSYLPDVIQTSAPINPGNSGGALVSLNGTVLGIPTLVQTSSSNGVATQNIGFAVPSERVVSIADQIIASGKVLHTGRAYLGITPSDASNQQSAPFGFDPNQTTPSTQGAVVAQLSSSGPAGSAGVQQGDVITAVGSTEVASAQDLLTVLAGKKPGDHVTLHLDRNGSTLSVSVTLGELPA